MTQDVKARAFDAFFTTKTRGLGTGLGLPLVRSVVLGAGGEIDVETRPGKGTEIVLTFPAAHNHDAGSDGVSLAAVYLLDARVASMAVHIIEAAGWRAARTEQPDPGECSIWVTEPCERAFAAARLFAKQSGRAVIAVGQPRPRRPWNQVGAIFVENGRDFNALRIAVGRAIRVVKGAEDS